MPKLPRNDLMHPGAAEAALAAAHARGAAAFYAVDGARRDGAVQRVHDLALRHGFAPADDTAVQRIFPDGLRLLLRRHFVESFFGAGVDEALLFLQRHARARNQRQRVLRNRRRAGKARAFDAAQRDEAGRGLPNDKIALVGIGAHARKIADIFPEVYARHALDGLFPHECQRVRLCGNVLAAAGLRIGADDKVVVNRRRNEHTLAVAVGTLENNVVHHIALAFVQKVVFTSAGNRGKARFTRHRGHQVRLHARRVHHGTGFKIAFCSMQPPAAADFLRACHSCFQMEFHAVFYGGLGQRQRQIPRLHNGRTGRIQRAAHRIGKIRLHGQRFLPRQHAHAGHAVRHTVFVQAAHGCHFLIGKSQHQAADLAVFDVERSALLFRQRTSPHIQPRHGGARFRVVPRVHDGAVGACACPWRRRSPFQTPPRAVCAATANRPRLRPRCRSR